MTCPESFDPKYQGRPGPPRPANTPGCHNTFAKGNDGNMYQSKPNKNGVFTWKKVDSVAEEKKHVAKKVKLDKPAAFPVSDLFKPNDDSPISVNSDSDVEEVPAPRPGLRSLMLAAKAPENLDKLSFPLLASTKYDGQRIIRWTESVLSRNLIPLPNADINRALMDVLPKGADCEILVNRSLRDTASLVRSRKLPIPKKGANDTVEVYWFDMFFDDPDMNFAARYKWIQEYKLPSTAKYGNLKIIKVENRVVRSAGELERMFEAAVEADEEGLMLRKPGGKYVQGRSPELLKLKRFKDDEAVILGFENNPKVAGQIRSISVQWGDAKFKVAAGLTDAMRKDFFKRSAALKGKLLTFRYQEVEEDASGRPTKPRHPKLVAVREDYDL
jgi:ATP-dependent DNA ligase